MPAAAQHPPGWWPWLSEKATAASWTLLAAGVAFYGTGEADLAAVVLHDPRVNR
jgi:hypothetical protein